MRDSSIVFASSKPFSIEDSKCEGLKRRLLNLPPSALKPKHNDIVDAVCMGLALSEGKKISIDYVKERIETSGLKQNDSRAEASWPIGVVDFRWVSERCLCG